MTKATEVSPAVARMSDKRPTTKLQLPIRIVPGFRNGRPTQILEYDGLPRADGQKMPFQREVMDPNINPFEHYVVVTNQAFWEMEARVDGLIKERDDLLLAQIDIQGENERLKSQVAEFKRQVENLKSKKNGGGV